MGLAFQRFEITISSWGGVRKKDVEDVIRKHVFPKVEGMTIIELDTEI